MPRSAEELIEFARRVQGNAYAPYSDYPVGAALEDDQGRLFLGVNVENISFGGTICAERSAITAMVSAGSRRWRQIAVVTRDGNTPCGMCRQVLAEFADPDALIICASTTDETGRYRIGDLLPHAFDATL